MWLLPQLLPPAKPEQLAHWKKPEDLVLRYKYDFLPNGIISRLTVRLHRFVRDPRMAWVTGVLFERDTTAVLAQVLEKGDEIELRARGVESKDLLSVVASDLDALNTSFQGLRGKPPNTPMDRAVEPDERLLERVDKRIPCNCELCRTESVPWFFGQKALLRRKEHNVRTVQCDRSFKEVDVLQLLDGVKFDRLPGWANEVPGSPALRTIRIFLASSSELREDCDEFELYFRRLNDQLGNTGLYLELVRWENFLDAMSDTRLQDEYNKYVRACDIFVSLFFTKAGKFTKEEFNVAYGQFKDTGKPHIYTFFKDADIKTRSARKEDLNSLWDFQTMLEKLGHYCTFYENTQDLKLQFRSQLDKLLCQQYGAPRAGG
jgi:internalin A